SAPHADSRGIDFDANGNLIEGDDGGVYRRTNPSSSSGDWFSISGTLQITEVYSVAYDPVSHIIFGGAQDNGTSRQSNETPTTWRAVRGGDGGDVAVDPYTLASSNQSIRYLSFQSLGNLERVVYDANNGLVSRTSLFSKDMNGADIFPLGFTPTFFIPIEVNAVQPTAAELAANKSTRLVIGANTVFEADDAGVAAPGAVNWNQVPTAP